MNKIILSTLIICLSINSAYSQKSKVQSAFNYLKYDQIDKAKQNIDEAVLDESTKANDKAWYYRGLIYMALYKHEKFNSLCDHCLSTAYQSFKKAQELDPKSEWADSSKSRIQLVNLFIINDGVEKFNAKDFPGALGSFEEALQIKPTDTMTVRYAAISAERAGNNAKAKLHLQQLMDMNVKDNKVYASLANLYTAEHDSVKALSIIREGRKQFPDSLNLMFAEINMLIPMNKAQEASELIEKALAKEPNNVALYRALGDMYLKLAYPKDAAGEPLPKPANFDEYREKCEKAYLKGLSLDKENIDLNFNLGALYYNEGVGFFNSANGLPVSQTAKYNELRANGKEAFLKAQPYFEKAHQLNPADQGVMLSLKELYAKTDQFDKSEQMKAELEKGGWSPTPAEKK